MASTQFSLSLAEFAKKVPKRADQLAGKVVLDMLTNIVRLTPVDTGRARAGWQVSPGMVTGAASSPLTAVTAKDANTTVMRNLGPINQIKFKDGVIAYIYNNVVYIVPLEYGHSRQNPYGMVRVTVAKFQQFIRAALAGLK